MATAVTHGILVDVKATFDPALSDPRAAHFMFSYRVVIENTGRETVKLLRRHWTIIDSLAPMREVEGAGVVGETPVLAPGERFVYNSAYDLRSSIGYMQGTYLMERKVDGHRFRVDIPMFVLQYPFTTN